jgi:hypothetical protein
LVFYGKKTKKKTRDSNNLLEDECAEEEIKDLQIDDVIREQRFE